jgi:hypothetical protein
MFKSNKSEVSESTVKAYNPSESDEPSELDPQPETPEAESEESPVKQYFESLDDSERKELCQLVKDYESQQAGSKEMDMEGMEESE